MKYTKDYYQILGVNPKATAAEIRRAYRRLAILYHPDRNPTSQSNARMQEINEAYGVIGNHKKRTAYDFQHSNLSTDTPTNNPYSYNQTWTPSRSQYPFVRGGILVSSFVVLILVITMFLRANHVEALLDDVMYFGEETTFVANNSTIGPIDASPFEGMNDAIYIEKYGLTIRPVNRQAAIGVINLPYNNLPSDLFVAGSPEYSNLIFEFKNNTTGFGFAIFNETEEGYSGVSNFTVTLKQDNRTVGILHFSTPADGVVFVGFISEAPFNTIVLMEADGGPEEQFGCCPDQEAFGKFYIVP